MSTLLCCRTIAIHIHLVWLYWPRLHGRRYPVSVSLSSIHIAYIKVTALLKGMIHYPGLFFVVVVSSTCILVSIKVTVLLKGMICHPISASSPSIDAYICIKVTVLLKGMIRYHIFASSACIHASIKVTGLLKGMMHHSISIHTYNLYATTD